ncbi:MAG: aldose epimerase family protein [Pseudomonadota bacterium]
MTPTKSDIRRETFGQLRDGREVQLFTLTNAAGSSLSVTNYGCIITAVRVPDRQGTLSNVVLGYETMRAYEDDTAVVGAFVGRFANRIAHGRVSIDGAEHQLVLNAGGHHLHGGATGFHKQLWSADACMSPKGPQLFLLRTSPDGEEGYPGALATQVVYTLTDDDMVMMDVTARTDRPTLINVIQHTYFNLTGSRRSVLHHDLMVNADEVLCVDQDLIPTGDKRNVAGTPFDFRTSRRVGEAIDAPDQQLRHGQGYDHCFVLNGRDGPAATLRDAASGREMTVTTDQPGLQVYSGNWLNGVHAPRTGLCLETQHFPDSPHHPSFPSTLLRPGEIFRTQTAFQFTTV